MTVSPVLDEGKSPHSNGFHSGLERTSQFILSKQDILPCMIENQLLGFTAP